MMPTDTPAFQGGGSVAYLSQRVDSQAMKVIMTKEIVSMALKSMASIEVMVEMSGKVKMVTQVVAEAEMAKSPTISVVL